ncbi:MAG: hypothetical protein QOI98_2324 [Solirubrobacteraceae bacterium]|nr:hypothetical protein [Solirubrobacteraceae bacterium]
MRRSLNTLKGHACRQALTATVLVALAAAIPAYAAGGLDKRFGAGGRVRSQFGVGSEPSSEAFAGAVDSAGHLLVVGTATNSQEGLNLLLARYLSNGALDSSFGFGGSVVTQVGLGPFPTSTGVGLLVQPDGNLVVASSATDEFGAPAFAVSRFTVAGTLDETFGTRGTIVSQLGSGASTSASSEPIALARQHDGKLLLVGKGTDRGGNDQVAIARYTASGIDRDYGSAGSVVTQLGVGSERFSEGLAVAIARGQRAVVAGNATDSKGREQVAVARFTASGVLDRTFGQRGVRLIQLGNGPTPSSRALAVAVLPDQRVVVVGDATDKGGHQAVALARFSASGKLDKHFGGDGRVVVQLGTRCGDCSSAAPLSSADSIALAPGGKILVGGQASSAGGYNVLLARFTSSGNPDRTFGSKGHRLTQLGSRCSPGCDAPAALSNAETLLLRRDGGIFVAGRATDRSGNNVVATARFRPSAR